MKVALINPNWTFDGSIYFGCREPHLPLEHGYAAALLRARGHEAKIFDAQLRGISREALRAEVEAFGPDMAVVTTAPSYLFWRCAPPELRVPQETVRDLQGIARLIVAIGPHASTTPAATLKKLGAHVAVMGECEEVLVELAETPREEWAKLTSIAFPENGSIRVLGGPRAADMKALPALTWDDELIERHRHHHHRFDRTPELPGAEVEASRGCPYACTFCAKDNFRDKFRTRPLPVILDEIDGLLEQGVEYIYFIDEIFIPNRPLLEALATRNVLFGVQMRIDLWRPDMLDLLGEAGCVSIEAGVESITHEGRSLLAKRCRMSTEELSSLLIHAKKRIPFVQANLLDSHTDDPAEVRAFRDHLRANGVWANDPVPMFHYPGSPGYTLRWGAPDETAWERALEDYLDKNGRFSEIQESRPLPLSELERRPNV
ncbi:MAG TPA: TIGR04295 family B12-binding domain-containing radical SAM protein [Polyangiaceae bacterium]|nr:TIGR04295 family B12-binding domain-containing radical SAM protein [Polyangiaceae bacterium]